MIRFVDYETTSRCDLPSEGQHNYAEDPTTEILMVGTAIQSEVLPPWVIDDLRSDDNIYTNDVLISWGGFDQLIARSKEEITPAWVDASALALYVGLPRSLQKFCKAVSIDAEKDPRGTRLINKYSRDPGLKLEGEDRKAFEEYCLKDVVLLQKAWKVLEPLLPEWERTQRENYELYEVINQRGVPIDVPAVEEALRQIRLQEEALTAEFVGLTGFQPTQTAKITEWLGLPDVQRETLLGARFKDPAKARAVEIRLLTSNATVKKLEPMLARAKKTGRARGCFTNNGAHTGRSTSEGIQFQNMKRAKSDPAYFEKLHAGLPTENPLQDAQKNIRGFIKPPEGYSLVVADYSQVEVRVLAWITGDSGLLSIFERGGDPYREYGGRMLFKKPEDVTDTERQISKIALLGSGYGAGGPALAAQAPGYGVHLTESQAWELIDQYKEMFPGVENHWNRLDRGLIGLVEGRVSKLEIARCVYTMNRAGTALKCVLPSGRALRYMFPRIEKPYGRKAIVFTSRFGRKSIWGGHFVENICQAIATDLKLDAMKYFADGVIAEVHDEIILEEPTDIAEAALEDLIDAMENPGVWFDHRGLIKATGSVMERYSK